MPVSVDDLVTDLRAESDSLFAVLAPLPNSDWLLPTPAANWSIADTVTHLAFFDEVASLACVDPEQFGAVAQGHMKLGMDFPDRVAEDHRHLTGDQILPWFERVRAEMIENFARFDLTDRVPWYGPSMSVASMFTARLMETWAHGQDVVDALGITVEPTARLRHVAHIGIGARAYTYKVRGLEVPEAPIRVELTAPDGSLWTWGPDNAENRVSGSAFEFCRVVTQRQNVADTSLSAVGNDAVHWMSIAQAFAGAAGPGRPARSELEPA
jgi:uncharacterized protein (TIGR03084 family)